MSRWFASSFDLYLTDLLLPSAVAETINDTTQSNGIDLVEERENRHDVTSYIITI
jgi:hypothetical protein